MDKRTHKSHGLSKEAIESLYLGDGLSDSEIGKAHGLSGEGVAYFRKKFGIKTLTPAERTAIHAKNHGLRDFTSVSDEELKALYDQHGMAVLGRMFGCSKIPVRDRLRRLGVASKSKQARLVLRYPTVLSACQQELLLGSLLGDGGVYSNESGDASRFKEMHAVQQRDYLFWKHSILLPFANRIHKEVRHLEDGRDAHGFGFNTCFHPLFQPYRDMFYFNGKKRLPPGLMDSITPFSLAVWYMDDGHLSDQNQDGVFTLATGFEAKDVEEIIAKLNRRFQFDIEPRENEDVTILQIHNKQRFFDIVGRHVISSMSYKIPLSLRFRLPYVGKPQLYGLPERLTAAEISTPSPSLLDDLTEYWQIAGFPFPGVPKKEKRLAELESVRSSKIVLDGLISSGHTNGCGLCLSFFDNVWTVKRNGKKSPMEVFSDAGLLRHAIADCLKHRGGCSSSVLRNELRTFGGVQTFRPSVARAIYDKYCPVGGRVLDPCSGWGGRLFGFYASSASEYFGFDACPETVKGLKHMRCILNRDVLDKKVEIRYAAFEDVNIEGDFDLVFTSPPYFNKELYGDDERQSHVRYKTYDEWLKGFLYPMVDHSVRLLKRGGFLVVNIADVKVGNELFPLASDLRRAFQSSVGIDCEYRMEFRSPFGGDSRFEPIIVGQKK